MCLGAPGPGLYGPSALVAEKQVAATKKTNYSTYNETRITEATAIIILSFPLKLRSALTQNGTKQHLSTF